MHSPQNRRQNRRAFLKAKKQAGDSGRVCGTYTADGEPLYFVVPTDATDEQIRARAFELRHGRPMNRAEELLSMAQSGEFMRAYEAAMEHYLTREEDPLVEAFAYEHAARERMGEFDA